MIFDNDFQIDIKAILALFLGGSLVACTGDDGSSSSTVTVPPVAAAPTPTVYTSNFSKVVSVPLTSASLAWEAITVADINGDGYKDLILANGTAGRALNVVTASDPRTTIAINTGAHAFTQLNTNDLNPTGWVNDWLVVPATQGNPYIVGIDHGREAGKGSDYWSKMEFYRYENGKIVDYTNASASNLPKFYHNATSYGDFNGDGMMDFVVARIDDEPFSVFYGDKEQIFKQAQVDSKYTAWDGQDFVGQTGAAVTLDIGADGKQDFVLLPYNNIWGGKMEGVYAEIFNNQLQQTAKIDVRTKLNIPDEWGFAFAQVADINGDGLQDFVALLENPIQGASTGVRGFATFMQTKDGTFDYFASTPTLLVDSKQTSIGGGVWSEHKFQLVDVNGDKKLDLFWGSWFNGKPADLKNSVFYGDGVGHFTRNETLTADLFRDVTWDGGARTYMDDFNNDGIGDLLVLQDYINLITPIVYINNGVVL